MPHGYDLVYNQGLKVIGWTVSGFPFKFIYPIGMENIASQGAMLELALE